MTATLARPSTCLRRSAVFATALGVMAGVVTGPAAAQNSAGIAAIVNDEVISAFDLDSRLGLVVAFSNIPNSAEVRSRIRPQVLRTMIDERIKMQEAERLEVNVPKADIAAAVARIERLNGLSPGAAEGVLSRVGIDRSVLEGQVIVDLAWIRVVNLLFRPLNRVSDQEIDDVLAEMRRNAGQPEFQVAEIFLPVDEPRSEAQVTNGAHRLVQQIRNGASFRALAQNFSQSATAGVGGDLGWIRLGQLGNEIDAVLATLQPGQVSPPIRTADGFTIVTLRDKRTSKGAPVARSTPITVELQRLFLPVAANAPPVDVARQTERARALTAEARSCADIDRIGKRVGSGLSGNLGKIELRKLPAQTRNMVKGLPLATPSQPMRSGDGVIVLMVCERTGGPGGELDPLEQRQRVRSRLMSERLQNAARQHLRNLRRAAFIDIRVPQ